MLRLIKQKGIASLVILGIMGVLAISLPVATKLVQDRRDSRSSAAEEKCVYNERKCVGNIRYVCKKATEWSSTYWEKTDCAKAYPVTAPVCSGGYCYNGKSHSPSITPTPTTSVVDSTITPTVIQTPVCTPPLCRAGEVYFCESTCTNGCGTRCVTPTLTPPTPTGVETSSTSNANLYFSPLKKENIAIGTTFIAWVRVNSRTQIIGGVDVVGTYDPTALELVSAVKSTNMVFGTDGDCVIDKAIAGKFIVSCYANNNTLAKAVNGNLARLTFKALKVGQHEISFDCTQGLNSDSNIVNTSEQDIIVCDKNVKGVYIITDGTVTLINTPTPTPTLTPPTPTPTQGQTGYAQPILPPTGANLVFNKSSDTLKVSVQKVNNGEYYVTRMWIKDPYNQFKTAITDKYGQGLEENNNIINKEITNKNLKDKIVVAVNGMPGYSENKVLDGVNYKFQPLNPVFIYEGINKTQLFDSNYLSNKEVDSPDLYGIDKYGNLRAFNWKWYSGENSLQEVIDTRKKTVDQINNLGIKYTVSFWDRLIINGELRSREELDGGWGSNLRRQRTVWGQIDKNNFIFITYRWEYNKDNSYTFNRHNKTMYEVAQIAQNLGCKTAVNLDGGGSIGLWVKDRGATNMTRIQSNRREQVGVLYVTE